MSGRLKSEPDPCEAFIVLSWSIHELAETGQPWADGIGHDFSRVTLHMTSSRSSNRVISDWTSKSLRLPAPKQGLIVNGGPSGRTRSRLSVRSATRQYRRA